MKKLDSIYIYVQSKINSFRSDDKGVVAFEYIIVLVIMAVAVFSAWGILSNAIQAKASDIATFIQNNGQGGLGTTAPTTTP